MQLDEHEQMSTRVTFASATKLHISESGIATGSYAVGLVHDDP